MKKSPSFKLIPLTKGLFTKVDAADFDELSKYRWYAYKRTKTLIYAVRTGKKEVGEAQTVKMHSHLMKPVKPLQVDHIDGDGLNNQRSNLRICTAAQNNMNLGWKTNNTSGYRGVWWEKGNKAWRSDIRVNKKIIYLGHFKDKYKAHLAYEAARKKYHGEYARKGLVPTS